MICVTKSTNNIHQEDLLIYPQNAGNLAAVESADLDAYEQPTDDEDDAPEPSLFISPFPKKKKTAAPRKVVKQGTSTAKTATQPMKAMAPPKSSAKAATKSTTKQITKKAVSKSASKKTASPAVEDGEDEPEEDRKSQQSGDTTQGKLPPFYSGTTL
jgi:hypothetical protein